MPARATKPPDLSEFDQHRRNQGPRCWYEKLELAPDQLELLDAAMASARITHPQVERWLREKHAIRIGHGQIARHRKGECRCQ